jgi:predicted O-methyltransferase YrrM
MQQLTEWIDRLFQQRTLLLMGHAQRREDLNLGLGWLYYAFARMLRPATAVVIGSYRGFAPLVFARAMADNSERGCVHFIDPGLVDEFWHDKQHVRDYFAEFGVSNIQHHLATTQQFVASDAYRQLDQLGIVFIDGYHTAEQAKFDFEAFACKLAADGMILLHDSVARKHSTIYGPDREYVHTVTDLVTVLKNQSAWQVLDIPFGDGVTVVRRANDAAAGARMVA